MARAGGGGVKARTLCILGKHCTKELHHQIKVNFLNVGVVTKCQNLQNMSYRQKKLTCIFLGHMVQWMNRETHKELLKTTVLGWIAFSYFSYHFDKIAKKNNFIGKGYFISQFGCAHWYG